MSEIIEQPTILKAGGIFTFQHIRDGIVIDEWDDANIIPDEGIVKILSSALTGASAISSWFVGIYKNAFTPIASNTMATFPTAGVANESTTDYSEAARPAWTYGSIAANALSNSASPAVFTFTPASTVINGAFLSSSNVKAGTTGTLLAATKFAASRTLLTTDTLNVTYTISASST
jgi:hypothetical protein